MGKVAVGALGFLLLLGSTIGNTLRVIGDFNDPTKCDGTWNDPRIYCWGYAAVIGLYVAFPIVFYCWGNDAVNRFARLKNKKQISDVAWCVGAVLFAALAVVCLVCGDPYHPWLMANARWMAIALGVSFLSFGIGLVTDHFLKAEQAR